jgi:bifunctional ADP-heptose synthase (sugar kinase/adenylyltransferase)
MLFAERGKIGGIVPTFAREVFDVSGAGDTVIAVLSLALLAGASLEEAVTIANTAAGVVVGKLGTATVSREEILAYARDHGPSPE